LRTFEQALLLIESIRAFAGKLTSIGRFRFCRSTSASESQNLSFFCSGFTAVSHLFGPASAINKKTGHWQPLTEVNDRRMPEEYKLRHHDICSSTVPPLGGAGRVTPAVNAFRKAGYFDGFRIGAIDLDNTVTKYVGRRFGRELRDFNACLIRERDFVPGFCLKSLGISSRQNVTAFVPNSAASAITTSSSGSSSPKPIKVGVVPEPREIATKAVGRSG
jgi:hypothetical protein